MERLNKESCTSCSLSHPARDHSFLSQIIMCVCFHPQLLDDSSHPRKLKMFAHQTDEPEQSHMVLCLGSFWYQSWFRAVSPVVEDARWLHKIRHSALEKGATKGQIWVEYEPAVPWRESFSVLTQRGIMRKQYVFIQHIIFNLLCVWSKRH